MKNFKLHCFALASLAGFSDVVQAHTGISVSYDFSQGFWHVLSGLDHCLLMLGLGLWASSQSRLFANRGAFSIAVFMLAGTVLGWQGFSFAYLETAMLLSVLTIGIALSLGNARYSAWLALSTIAVFAGLHGLSHGQEMPVGVSGQGYIIGLLLASLAFYFSGLLAGNLAKRKNLTVLIPLFGTLVGITGAWLLFAA